MGDVSGIDVDSDTQSEYDGQGLLVDWLTEQGIEIVLLRIYILYKGAVVAGRVSHVGFESRLVSSREIENRTMHEWRETADAGRYLNV